jgi:hypothetical protein
VIFVNNQLLCQSAGTALPGHNRPIFTGGFHAIEKQESLGIIIQQKVEHGTMLQTP